MVAKKRARTKKGTYKGDDLSTPDVNEAYVKENMFHLSVIESYNITMKRFGSLWGDDDA